MHKAVEIVKSGILGPIVGVIGSAVFYNPMTISTARTRGARNQAADPS
jgi:hypothetical protein